MNISWSLCEYHQRNPDPDINAFGLKITERMRNLGPGDFLPTGDVNEIGCDACYANARVAFPAEPLKLGEFRSMVYDADANDGQGGWVLR